MGYNTTVLIRNDAWHEIEKDANFGKKLYNALQEYNCTHAPAEISSGYHANAACVVETHHADGINLIAVGGNIAEDLGYCGDYRATKLDLLKTLADRLGYRIVKKSNKTRQPK